MSNAKSSFTNELALGEFPRGDRKPRVIVTGGSGKLGRSTVKYLSDEGWEVISVDTRRPAGISEDGKSGLNGAYRLVEIDLEDMGSVLETFMTTDMAYSGIDAVVHLAAIPSPGQTSASRQFRTNTMGTYNVLEACRKLKIKNIVLASSETLIGIPFDPHPPESLPITEEHERNRSRRIRCRSLWARLWRSSMREYSTFEGWQKDPKLRYWNCWGYIDARDGAQSVHLSLKSEKKGHHQYLIAAPDTCMRMSNDELVKAVFPNVKYNKTAGPNDTLLSIEKAKKELGFKPAYKWQDQVGK
ncbi:hypothetical protein B0A54_11449 [Friedmanniomyces endolithicus]|uniref:NAD-dependent epimerase/dehydratase domain-containing protein n=1 Tax=Friedmanniomyces endolithicus TaxID=329885 RepID=A0A4U0UNQ7_9PEZI|nr:hypothetical protein B0A54_11449 [Friedmanniomyces endolithicus]